MISLKQQDAPVKQPFGTNAVRFLQLLYPYGPWVLTAIVPDGRAITATFTDPERARGFIAEHNGNGENVYYSINPTKQHLRSKAGKQDIAEVVYLHVDADPRDDESPAQAKARIRQVLASFPHRPTFEVDSGNGLQLLWQLEKPIELTDAEVIKRTEARNYALAEVFGADPATRNIDRIFRLPGTTNYPNKRKKERGRVECWAKLVEFNDAVYRRKCFPVRVEPEPEPPSEGERPTRAEARSELPRNLRQMLYHTTKAGYPTRSELVFSFICQAIRKGVRDAAIIAAIEHEASSVIWQHCQDCGGLKYLRRQIAQAHVKIDAGDHETRALTVRSLDQFAVRKLDWMWYPFIPRGALSMMFGDGEVGKSTLALELAARISRGDPWPQFDAAQPRRQARRGSVIIICKEDDAALIIRPRLEAAGADLSKICILGYNVPDNPADFDPVSRLDTIADEVDQLVAERGDVEAILIDPITEYLGQQHSGSDESIRELMTPYGRLAARHELAVVFILHLNKKTDLPVQYRALGGVGFRSVSKSTLLVAKSKEHPDWRLLAMEKHNLTAEKRTVAFRLVPAPRSAFAKVEWVDGWQDDIDIDDMLTPVTRSEKQQQAVEFLRSTLSPQPMAATEVMRRGKEARISESTLRRAKAKVPGGVIIARQGDGWTWRIRGRRERDREEE